jgi:hypothetical protein
LETNGGKRNEKHIKFWRIKIDGGADNKHAGRICRALPA